MVRGQRTRKLVGHSNIKSEVCKLTLLIITLIDHLGDHQRQAKTQACLTCIRHCILGSGSSSFYDGGALVMKTLITSAHFHRIHQVFLRFGFEFSFKFLSQKLHSWCLCSLWPFDVIKRNKISVQRLYSRYQSSITDSNIFYKLELTEYKYDDVFKNTKTKHMNLDCTVIFLASLLVLVYVSLPS